MLPHGKKLREWNSLCFLQGSALLSFTQQINLWLFKLNIPSPTALGFICHHHTFWATPKWWTKFYIKWHKQISILERILISFCHAPVLFSYHSYVDSTIPHCHPDSPIHCSCMPDPQSTRSINGSAYCSKLLTQPMKLLKC